MICNLDMFKGWSGTKNLHQHILFLLFLFLFHLVFVLLKKLLPALIEQLKMVAKLQEIHLLVFFISCFTVSVTLSINTPEPSKDFVILMISFISSFEINKVNFFPTLTAPFPLIFLSNIFIAFEVKSLTNSGKLSLAKVIAMFVSALLNYLTRNQKIHLIKLF